MTSVAAQLKAIQQKSMVKAEAVFRETMFEIGADIIFNSPVRDGLFKSNWLSGYAYDTSTTETINMAAAEAQLRQAVDGLTTDKQFYFTNSLPYADRLENGHWSQQAPNGMVKIALAQFDTIAQEKINKYK